MWSFFFNDTATTEIYPLSLHDALPISLPPPLVTVAQAKAQDVPRYLDEIGRNTAFESVNVTPQVDRKSTRLNSSHGYISYAVFCLKKKNKHRHTTQG